MCFNVSFLHVFFPPGNVLVWVAFFADFEVLLNFDGESCRVSIASSVLGCFPMMQGFSNRDELVSTPC